jgi:hypothetical protein
MHCGEQPIVPVADRYMRGAQARIGVVALVLGPLAVASDGYGGVAVVVDLDVIPYQ